MLYFIKIIGKRHTNSILFTHYLRVIYMLFIYGDFHTGIWGIPHVAHTSGKLWSDKPNANDTMLVCLEDVHVSVVTRN